MAGWHHQLSEHEFEKLQEMVMDREGGLACCSPWGCEESNVTEQLNNNNQSNENQSYGRAPQEEEMW